MRTPFHESSGPSSRAGLRFAVLAVLLAMWSWTAFAQESSECMGPQAVKLSAQGLFAELETYTESELAKLESAGTTVAVQRNRICLTTFLAASRSQLRKLDEALALQERNVEAASRQFGPQDKLVLEARMHLATIQQKAGRYDDAIPALRALLPLFEQAWGADSLEVVTVLRNIATSLHWVGNFADALPYDERRLRIVRAFRVGKQCPSAGWCAKILADAHAQLGDTLRRVKREAEAQVQVEQALRLYEQTAGPLHPSTLDAKLTLASIAALQGRAADAERLERQVIADAERTLGPRHALTLKAKGNLAVTLSLGGNQADAADLDSTRLDDLRRTLGPDHPDTLQATQNLAMDYLRGGQTLKATALLRTAVAALLARPDGIDFDDRSRAAWERWFSGLTDSYLDVLVRARRGGDAFLFAEQIKAAQLVQRVGALDLVRPLAPEQWRERKALRTALGRADQDIALARSLGRPTQALEAERAALFLRWRQDRQGAGVALADATNIPAWTRHLLDAAPAVVSYKFSGDRLYGFVVQARTQAALLLDTQGTVRASVEAYRLAMRDQATGPRTADARPALWKLKDGSFTFGAGKTADMAGRAAPGEVLAWLSAKIVTPLLRHLPAQSRLLVSVDGNLGHVPFDALPLDGQVSGGERLGERYALSILPTFAMHDALAQRTAIYRSLVREPMLAFGGAPYARVKAVSPFITLQREPFRPPQPIELKAVMQAVRQDAGRLPAAMLSLAFGLPDLPGTETEVHKIAALYGGATILTGEGASEANFIALARDGRLENFRYLHFAAHGFLSDDEPLLSAIVLSQIGRAPGTDGYLTVAEIAATPLRADLVVVSSCDSGATAAPQGAGQSGLAAALLEAGANGSVLTLWPVPDRDTPQLMEHLYAELGRGHAPPVALQRTKQWARGQGMPDAMIDAFVYWGL